MSTYRMEDGTVVKTKNATQSWKEDVRWSGRNQISVATGSQWIHQRLHRSRKGRYWVEQWSQWEGSTPRAEWLSREAATRWLIVNGHDLPNDLKDLEAEVCE